MLEILATIFVALTALIYFCKRSGMAVASSLLATLAISATGFLALVGRYPNLLPEHPTPPVNRPIEVESLGYVSDDACAACHPHEFKTWSNSYHRTMTQEATPETVLGDFADREFYFENERYVLCREDDQFFVESDGPLGSGLARIRRPIVLLTGSHHMQVYWYSTGRRRELAPVPFVYLLGDEQRWVPEPSTFLRPPEIQGLGSPGLWNVNCIKCHTTQGRPRHKDTRLGTDTHVAQFGISCQACHGPGEEHIAANQDPARRYIAHIKGDADPTVAQPARLRADRSSEVCGQCHSIYLFDDAEERTRWATAGFSFRPGDNLDDRREVVRQLPNPSAVQTELLSRQPDYMVDRYWSDGMVRVSGREYNGLIESPCAVDPEFSCLSCHVMHQSRNDPRPAREWANDQLGFGMETNQACTQCHPKWEDDEELVRHTHHAANSTGSLCYNCHMSYTSYGLLKAIRSHEIDSPSVRTSLETGRPNACNQCHLDRTHGWAAENLTAWGQDPNLRLSEDDRAVPASILWALTGDAGQRALAAWSMGWADAKETSKDDWLAPYLAQLLIDPYAAVRYISGRSLRSLPGFGSFDYDHVASEDEQKRARELALQIWREQRGDGGEEINWQVLLGGTQSVHPDRFAELLARRNDRPVSLKE